MLVLFLRPKVAHFLVCYFLPQFPTFSFLKLFGFSVFEVIASKLRQSLASPNFKRFTLTHLAQRYLNVVHSSYYAPLFQSDVALHAQSNH